VTSQSNDVRVGSSAGKIIGLNGTDRWKTMRLLPHELRLAERAVCLVIAGVQTPVQNAKNST
jgi:hypothetical protein